MHTSGTVNPDLSRDSSSSTPSVMISRTDYPGTASTPPSDILADVFLDDPSEDRLLIPLVSVSLDLLDVTEVNNPRDFLCEAAEIVGSTYQGVTD
ncbi:hypothetical protein FOMPIDRAFT_93912 [Fomitopsis schrenkii]|uniref:Uncharacterized protein n=1 Tax=Fomitopsis schrenkii TaxID=2126942 RepID=S8DN46_FOMSC|nr:hypothetical protein FOMPIDRAFT_93912 [Fomitopsis schrenkii]